MMKRKRTIQWYRGLHLWGTIEHGKLELSTESKLWLAKENNRRLALDSEIARLMQLV